MATVTLDTALAPNHAYYRACHGAWRSPMNLEITDATALRESGVGWADRTSLRLMAVWPAWLGRFYLDTTVSYRGHAQVLHTTVVRWLGLPLLSSTETIELAPDGRAFEMRGDQRVFPTLWRRRSIEGTGSVDETGMHATYHLHWLGAALRQTTKRHELGADIVQEGPGFRGVQHLRARVGVTPPP